MRPDTVSESLTRTEPREGAVYCGCVVLNTFGVAALADILRMEGAEPEVLPSVADFARPDRGLLSDTPPLRLARTTRLSARYCRHARP